MSILTASTPRVTGPLALLNTSRVRATKLESASFPAVGASLTLFQQSGSGEVRSLWLACGSGPIVLDARIQVFIDGESTPAIDMDMGTFFCWRGLDASTAGQAASTQHMSSGTYMHTAGERSYATMRFPMPFSNGISIQLKNTTSTVPSGDAAYAIVHSVATPDIAPYRLRGFGQPFPGGALFNRTAEVDLATVTGRGALVWFSYFGQAAAGTPSTSGYNWLERNISTFIDGEAVASIDSSGMEDYFFNGWYYEGRAAYSAPHAMLTNGSNASYNADQAVDWLELCGGIPFETSLRMHLGTEATVQADHYHSWSGLWYQRL